MRRPFLRHITRAAAAQPAVEGVLRGLRPVPATDGARATCARVGTAGEASTAGRAMSRPAKLQARSGAALRRLAATRSRRSCHQLRQMRLSAPDALGSTPRPTTCSLLPAPSGGDFHAGDETHAGLGGSCARASGRPGSGVVVRQRQHASPAARAASATSSAGASVPSEWWLWVCRSMRSHPSGRYHTHRMSDRRSPARSHRHPAAGPGRHAAGSGLRHPFLASRWCPSTTAAREA